MISSSVDARPLFLSHDSHASGDPITRSTGRERHQTHKTKHGWMTRPTDRAGAREDEISITIGRARAVCRVCRIQSLVLPIIHTK
jgi:hypothetical protein